ncbi:hypothetical protein BJI67_12880 [Acidihalobacter aeolianus]|uniref:Uncharacterized protein n=1 Tax=Acidihalobacter aeolianus TaxID=2792603 RepID=A0A1D8KA65_9GAMM|nr:hypothetical protein [Acidihalobacter aeolianus]AOV17826.1 hypothetical protein BJI67_12880 [Acidihalobacter aeolianus]
MGRITETHSAATVAAGWSIRSTAAVAMLIYAAHWVMNDQEWKTIVQWLHSGGAFPAWAILSPWMAGALAVTGAWLFVWAWRMPSRKRIQKTERGSKAATVEQLRKMTEKAK